MATFTQPTKNSIAQDGLKLSGYPNGGSSTQQTVAEGWIEEAKMDLYNTMNKYKVKLNSLLVTAWGVTTPYVSRYANPNDCDEIYSVTLCDGSNTGNCTTVNSIAATLDDSSLDASIEGDYILLTDGPGVGNCSQISDYNTSTQVATVTPNFSGSSFNGTEGYLIIDDYTVLEKKDPKEYDELTDPTDKDEPLYWYPQGQGNADADETGEFELYPTPDDTYGLKLRYYLNITLLDLTNDANLIGSIYRKFKPLFVKKVVYMQNMTDRNFEYAAQQEQLYLAMLESMVTDAKDVGYTSSPERMYY